MAAETQYTANTGMTTINAANTNLDGSGTLNTTIWSVITGASNGTLVKSITVKAVGSISAEGMVRLFVYDGTNTRLLAEIDIPKITKTSQDECFERYLELDLDLKSGYEIRATTHIADTFNIIAEGLDWAYYSGNVRPDSTNYTANTGGALITTANTSLTGSGTLNTDIWTVFTAGSSSTYKGSEISSIVIKGTTSSTADGMIRLFINDGSSTTKLFTEVPVPICTPGATNRSFVHQIDFPGGFNLQAGYKLYATTELSNSFTILVEGKDWKYPTVATGGLFSKNLTPASCGANTTETILHSHQIAAGMVAVGDLLEVYVSVLMNSDAHTKTFKVYAHTSNALGGTMIGQLFLTTNVTSMLSRTFPVVTDTSLELLGGTSNQTSQYGTSATSSSTVTVPSVSAGFWIIISGQKNNDAADTATVRWSMVKNARI